MTGFDLRPQATVAALLFDDDDFHVYGVIPDIGSLGAAGRMYHCGISTPTNPIGISMNFTSRLLGAIALSAFMMSAVMAAEAKVVSSISTLSYTYIEVIQDGKSLWLATDVITLKPGERISFNAGIMMTNFYSSDLQRTFAAMTFVEQVAVIPEK